MKYQPYGIRVPGDYQAVTCSVPPLEKVISEVSVLGSQVSRVLVSQVISKRSVPPLENMISEVSVLGSEVCRGGGDSP